MAKPKLDVKPVRNGTKVMTGLVRLAFVNVLAAKPNPSGALKYSTIALIDPKDDVVPMIKEACKAAALEKWGTADKIPKGLRNPLRDGDEKDYAGFEGFLFVSCNSDGKPGVIDAACKPVTDDSGVYSGCWARLDLNFFGYQKAGNQGVAAGLNNVQVLGHDDSFTGRQAAENVFGPVVSADSPFEAKPGKAVDADVSDLFA
jgi:hypothetical protein